MSLPERRVAVATTIAGAVAFVVVAAVLVPWDAVPGGPVTPVPAGTVFTPEQIERAEAFSRWARVWSWTSLGVSLAVAGWFALTPRGRRLVERLPGPWWVQVPLAVAALILVGRLVTLPCGVALQRLRLDYGLTRQRWTSYAADLARTEAVAIVLTSVAALVLVGCARRWVRAWPAVVGGLLAALVVLGSFVYPVVVEPVFNDFESLPAGPLRSDILALADQQGIAVDDVLVADASRRTTSLNAYVSGFSSTRRVVVYDNLVASLGREQALSVIAHELAHARHRDVLTGTVLGAAGSLFGAGLLGVVLGALRRRGHPAAGDAAVVPLVLALALVASLAGSPVSSTVSRQLEARADVDAVRASTVDTGGVDAFVSMQRRLALRSLADPTPPALAQLWFGSHPDVLTRIAIARRVG